MDSDNFYLTDKYIITFICSNGCLCDIGLSFINWGMQSIMVIIVRNGIDDLS